jgi:hypothetical protein
MYHECEGVAAGFDGQPVCITLPGACVHPLHQDGAFTVVSRASLPKGLVAALFSDST